MEDGSGGKSEQLSTNKRESSPKQDLKEDSKRNSNDNSSNPPKMVEETTDKATDGDPTKGGDKSKDNEGGCKEESKKKEEEKPPNWFPITVRWKGKNLPVNKIDLNKPPLAFMQEIEKVTRVPVKRQSILGFKGRKLTPNADWQKMGLKKNMTVLFTGTPDDKLPRRPQNVPKAGGESSTTVAEQHNFTPMYPPGLENLGNTCYMNATVQCLNSVDGLRLVLREFRGSARSLNPSELLTATLRDLMSRMNNNNASVINPLGFLAALRYVNPTFAEQSADGTPSQQDAEECLTSILFHLSAAFGSLRSDVGGYKLSGENPIDILFGITMKVTDRCLEAEAEQPVVRREVVRVLKCHISQKVNHLNEGIKLSLNESIEKTSEMLGRTAQWERTSQIDKLPPYLNVQFVRFFWKETEGVKAKILRSVSFPMFLDIYDFCTDELKDQINKVRHIFSTLKEEAEESSAAGASSSKGKASASNQSTLKDPHRLGNGHYELCAVITHKGRAADGGHYVAWCKQNGVWLQYDDDKVTIQREGDVLRLSGGGDWHMAYMCVYRLSGLTL